MSLFFKKTKFAILKFIYSHFQTPNKQLIVFFRTRLGKILIWQKFSERWESDFKDFLADFLRDLFQFFPNLNIINYADDNTTHSTNIYLNKVLHDLQKISDIYSNGSPIIFWRQTQKSHIFLQILHKKIEINIGGMAISNSKKLLGIRIDNKLMFEPHERSLYLN